jgi:hypothetical protein
LENKGDFVQYLIAHPQFNGDKSNAPLALMHAINLRAAGTITLLLGLDFDINKKVTVTFPGRNRGVQGPMTVTGVTALGVAVKKGSVTVIPQILAHPRFIPSRSCIDAALFGAIRLGDLATFQSLLALAGADTALLNAHDETLLVYCCLRGNVPILQAILQIDGFTPSLRELQKAAGAVVRADQGAFVPILSRLAKLDWNLKFPPGVNGGRVTGSPSRVFSVRHTQDRDLFPDISPGTTPLIAAVRHRREQVLRALYAEPNIDKSSRGEYGQTCLWELSVMHGSLFQSMDGFSGIDLNAQDMNGNTAAMFAVMTNQRDSLTLLIRQGADLDIKNDKGETVWDIVHTSRGLEPPQQPQDRDVLLRRVLALISCPGFRGYYP